ncbi:NADH-quinone oxidoreductase subunit NuoN [Hankyongella ginsenosidimutans]|uniref:NADH-quinone oxidoreductase subunit NuoN n=1 Tax=Hankyongella ginsenosidimutans TaxID=1763828 RepID=UPI001FE9D94A|nr:NADH-quinone oxidoreductase subunit NuoN [Hankyongella ginsenosidimutans]
MTALSDSLMLAAPELWLAVSALVLLLVGVFQGDRSYSTISWACVAVMVTAAALVANGASGTGFNGLFIVDAYAQFLKVVILAGSAATLIIAEPQVRRLGIARFEFPIVVLIATLGMLMMVSAGDLLSLYLGLELQSLSLYVLAAFHRDNARSTEAGLKYFVLGALSSGLLLYGVSLVYGFAGSTDFLRLQGVLVAEQAPSVGILFGLVFVMSGLVFKIAAVPFHMWTPDVYEGAPTPVTAFSRQPQGRRHGPAGAGAVGCVPGLAEQWRQIIIVASVGSMALGAIAAINQQNIKRLLAYSSIGHVGYALLGVAAGTEAGIESVLVYMAIYMATTIGGFLCVMAMQRGGQAVEAIDDLAGLARRQPRIAFALAMIMFSMAGIPLLIGFVGKLFVFQAAIAAGLVIPAVLGVLASVIAAYYYLRIVKVMYFDEPAPAFDDMAHAPSSMVLALSAAFASPLGYLAIGPLAAAAALAAKSLLG